MLDNSIFFSLLPISVAITLSYMSTYKVDGKEQRIVVAGDADFMAISMSPDHVMKKRYGIFIVQSQKDMAPFQRSDNREFWQRAKDRNASTADLPTLASP